MIETVEDKGQYERLIVDKNKTKDGWYSPDDGFLNFEIAEDLKKIQLDLKSAGINATLKDGEYCYNSYCTDKYFANWISYGSDQAFIDYAKKYFEINVSQND